MRDNNPRVLSTSSLSGNDVRNAQNENLGNIKDFVVDLDSGEIVYAVLSFGGFLGLGDKFFAIPWKKLNVDTENECFVLDVDKDALEDAPGFDKDNWPRRPQTDFINQVYTHYGYEPYYQEALV